MKNTLKTITIIGLGLWLTGCAPAKFITSSEESKNIKTETPPPPTICDPFDQSNVISATSGLKGTIHYLEAAQTRTTSSQATITEGTKVNADLFLNRVFVPTRAFSTGFAAENGTTIKDQNNNLLIEWFALDLHSKIKLGTGDAPGDYQLALLSDDGSTLALQNANGQLETVVDNEGLHPTKMACAAQVVEMDGSTRIPMSLKYFQGPRYHIAAILMWRKVDASQANALDEVECGKSGNAYFFKEATATEAAAPQTPYQNLLARGWKPLSAENFELQSGTNRCLP